jgi:cell division protein FtsI (penicillin-binding protein 3)
MRSMPRTRRFEHRLVAGAVMAALLGGLVVARLVHVQLVESPTLQKEAERQQTRVLEIPAERGTILAADGTPLALTLPADRRRDLPARREYPRGSLAAQVVGFCSADGEGLEGIEGAFDEWLRGTPGFREVGADARGRLSTVPGGRRRPALDGADVRLTLDPAFQSVLERELSRCVEMSGAVSACAVFLDPRTGDVLAMASWPTYDPGRVRESRPDQRRNRAIADINEPGSTFKLITSSACLEEGVVTPMTLVESSRKLELAGGDFLHDSEDYGWVTVEEALRKSVNTATAMLARKIGPVSLFEHARGFGFGCVTGIDLAGEVSGILRRPAYWSGRSLETIAIGQEIACTPLQLACAYGAVANGGVLMKPRLVTEIVGPNGETVRTFRPTPVRRVVSARTAADVTRMLTSVVEDGTATAAQIAGIAVAGKTGTAQRVDPETRKYDPRRHVGSFVGFLPAEAPQVVGVVVVDRPRGVGYGGEVAAPCFRRIVEGTLLASREPLLEVAALGPDGR